MKPWASKNVQGTPSNQTIIEQTGFYTFGAGCCLMSFAESLHELTGKKVKSIQRGKENKKSAEFDEGSWG